MIDFILPDIGEGIVECELLQWKVSEGDMIKEDQVVAEVMTDKATVEIPAMHSGKVSKLYYKEGDIAKVHAPLFAMESANDSSIADPQSVDGNSPSTSNSTNIYGSDTTVMAHQPDKTHHSESLQIESFILPDIGEGIVECEIMQWHVEEGELVSEDQVVVEVMTDKAIVEIPAKYAGQIVKLHYQKGDIAAVHSKLFDQALQVSGQPSTTIADRSSVKQESKENVVNLHKGGNKQGENFQPPLDIGKAIASPAVRRIARENNIDFANIHPSGAKGRVLKEDILNAIEHANSQSKHVTHDGTAMSTLNTIGDGSDTLKHKDMDAEIGRIEPIKGVRAAMAKQMMASVSTIPHFSVSDELCMDNLIRLRENLKQSFANKNQKLSFMPFFVKALSLVMQEYPIINSRLNDSMTELTYLGAHNIGVAVDSKIGLVVPNIKNVESKSLFEVTAEFNQLVSKAREGKLSNQDLSNGSISISNVGAIGGITATPIINKPNVAIVALGKTQKLPRFNDSGEIIASNIMTVNWSADHRVIDGATMVKFNNLWMDYLTNPEKMLMYLK